MSDYLCEELIDEILTRLPPKSLIRFRLVSKSLCSHISSRDFIRKNTLRYSPSQKVLFRHKNNKNKDFLQDFITLHPQDQLPLSPERGYNGIAAVKFLEGNFHIVGSCNAILCLLNYTIGFTLWNPSIRRKLTITKHPCWRHNYSRHCAAVGFGFDPTADDYKIVWIYFDKDIGVLKSYVYSMRTGTWFEVASPASPFSYVVSLGCFVNGALHWIIQHTTYAPELVCRRYILTFDLSSQIFGTIALPKPSREALRVMIINGSLGVIFSEGGNRMCIRVRRECNNTFSWSLFYRFNRNESILRKVLQLPATGDLLVNSFYHWLCVHPETRVQSELVEFNDSFKFEIEMFVETLELLDTGIAYELEDQPSFLKGKPRSITPRPGQVCNGTHFVHAEKVFILFSSLILLVICWLLQY